MELGSFDILKEVRSLSTKVTPRELEAQSQLHMVLRQEKIFWCQRSWTKWLKEGDAITKFFHAVTNGCHNHNLITCVHSKGGWIEGENDVAATFTNHFRLQFGAKPDFCYIANLPHLFNFKSQLDLGDLEDTF